MTREWSTYTLPSHLPGTGQPEMSVEVGADRTGMKTVS